VWCVPSDDDPVTHLNDGQRRLVLQSLLPAEAGSVVELSPLKHFALGLNAERTLVDGLRVRVGNAAQTLHPVAGQGLNLGLRDAHTLVQALRIAHDEKRLSLPEDVAAALRRVEWQRAPDRWTTIATTDFLARTFTWNWVGLAPLRSLALGALQALPLVKQRLAQQFMFGRR
jgi:2-octaprenyl-6-methoxyphenol hydroxylase